MVKRWQKRIPTPFLRTRKLLLMDLWLLSVPLFMAFQFYWGNPVNAWSMLGIGVVMVMFRQLGAIGAQPHYMGTGISQEDYAALGRGETVRLRIFDNKVSLTLDYADLTEEQK
ncbi:hypothetical protein [Endozoicomonas sp. ALB091]|uniref:hypothetical protein n=1 Tax=Endozoicomonas sp. ALB091 TaxID=3403073 RepID=UPI003BB79627